MNSRTRPSTGWALRTDGNEIMKRSGAPVSARIASVAHAVAPSAAISAANEERRTAVERIGQSLLAARPRQQARAGSGESLAPPRNYGKRSRRQIGLQSSRSLGLLRRKDDR